MDILFINVSVFNEDNREIGKTIIMTADGFPTKILCLTPKGATPKASASLLFSTMTMFITRTTV